MEASCPYADPAQGTAPPLGRLRGQGAVGRLWSRPGPPPNPALAAHSSHPRPPSRTKAGLLLPRRQQQAKVGYRGEMAGTAAIRKLAPAVAIIGCKDVHSYYGK